jgi:hypothetical protein
MVGGCPTRLFSVIQTPFLRYFIVSSWELRCQTLSRSVLVSVNSMTEKRERCCEAMLKRSECGAHKNTNTFKQRKRDDDLFKLFEDTSV